MALPGVRRTGQRPPCQALPPPSTTGPSQRLAGPALPTSPRRRLRPPVLYVLMMHIEPSSLLSKENLLTQGAAGDSPSGVPELWEARNAKHRVPPKARLTTQALGDRLWERPATESRWRSRAGEQPGPRQPRPLPRLFRDAQANFRTHASVNGFQHLPACSHQPSRAR